MNSKIPQEAAKAAEILIKAADYIRRYGWQEKGMSAHGKPRCSMGALASANPEPAWDPKVSELMYQTLYRELGGLTLTQYNRLARSGEDVVRLFKRTAQSLQRNT